MLSKHAGEDEAVASAATRGESVMTETWDAAGRPEEGLRARLSCCKAFSGAT